MGASEIGDAVRQIRRSVRQLDVAGLLSIYDVDFDVPLRHREALGLLQLARTVPGRGQDRTAELTARVGEAWCDVVRADVELDLQRGLSVADASRDDAERLRHLPRLDGIAAYVAARWYDGTGKVLYRVGSHARARMSFETADDLATHHGLWWCRPDLRSNRYRASWEEARQVGRVAVVVDALEREVADVTTEAATRGIPLGGALPTPPADREFLRGCSSLLHNLAVATATDDPARSLDLSRRAEAVSRALGDPYRRAQALLHQALLAERRALDLTTTDAVRLYRQVARLPWVRGQRIARQNLARLRGDAAGARALARLIDDIAAENAAAGGSAGLDTDFRQFTVQAYNAIAERLAAAHPTPQSRRRLDEARERTLVLARSVRRVIALPAYKRAYNNTVRPVFLRRLDRDVTASGAQVAKTHWEDTLSLVEESSSRELLDMMAASALPELGPPEPPGAPAETAAPGTEEPGPVRRGARRSGLRRVAPSELSADRTALMAREQEFEEQFLRRPLDAVAHDEEIARTAERFTVNNPGTCVVRYFGHGYDPGLRCPTGISAFVIRDTIGRPVHCADYPDIRALVDDLQAAVVPTEEHTRRIWALLIAPIWPSVVADGRPLDHLVVVPSDDLFSVPFHIAAEKGYDAGCYPLGALVPLSQSVSLSAYLTRGRHLLRRQRVEQGDDLAALVVRDESISADELLVAQWPPEHTFVAGTPPDGLPDAVRREAADWSGLCAVLATRPEFFVYAGHGRYDPSYGELGPFLDMRTADGRPDRLTPFDVALRIRLARNRLTVLGACLAGQGAQTAGGDVVGFLRAFIAAGSGVVALPLWEVLDSTISTTAGMLLRESRRAAAADGTFDVVTTLHRHYRKAVEDHVYWIDHLPLVIYT